MAAVGGIGGSFSNAIPMSDIMLCLLWGMLLQGFAHSLMIRATRLILSAEITLFMLLEFTLNPLWVWLFINDGTNFYDFIRWWRHYLIRWRSRRK